MNYRDYWEIFPEHYINAPEESYARERCSRHLECARAYRDVYGWITPIECPYQREAYATIMLQLINKAISEDGMLPSVQDEVEPELKRIIRYAQTDQMAEDMICAELGIPENKQLANATLAEHVSELEKQMAYLSKEVTKLKEKTIDSKHFTLPDDWFAAGISDDDRLTIEHMLHDLCNSNKRSASADIKNYLRLKAQTGQIIRPTQLNSEWKTLRDIGYKRTYSTYHNAGY